LDAIIISQIDAGTFWYLHHEVEDQRRTYAKWNPDDHTSTDASTHPRLHCSAQNVCPKEN
jgi:hypothetical protein